MNGVKLRTLLFALLLGLPTRVFAAEFAISPAEVRFADAHDRRQLLVSQGDSDRTSEAAYESSDAAIVSVDSHGYAFPVAPGKAILIVRLDSQSISVPVVVEPFDRRRNVDFANEIEPLLSRFGCNAGGCHGKASGQNGFKLSLFGFDPTFDYQAIVEEGRGRRLFPSSPQQSLLLRKAAGQSPHGGGRRLDPEDEPYQLLVEWIEQGMPRSSPDAPRVVDLTVEPPRRAFAPDERQQVRVTALYSDGATRDVTRQAQYASNLDVVALVDDAGLVTAGRERGEAAVMARYMGQVAVFTAIVPHGQPQAATDGFVVRNKIDELAAAKWRQLGLRPSPPADDATFLRRVTVDLCGRLPTVEETRAYLAEQSPGKRDALIERLLASPDYPAYFALRWGSILRNSNLAGSEQAAYAFHNWIKDMIARNRPYDEFVRGIVAAAGEWQDAPAINWYWQMRDDQLHQVVADTAQVFLGIRLQCARCHHHPYERWGQEDYYGLAGFFTRLGRKSFGEPPPYFSASQVTTGERNPLTGQTPEPKYPDGPAAKFTPEQDPRHGLVDWMSQSDNPYFARTLVNRLWGHFMGRGLVDPVDDMRETNPPSNPELLDWLAQDFVNHRYDVQHVIRTLVGSGVYALDAAPTEANRDDRQNFARFYGRRLIAEVFHDAVDQACGTHTAFGGVSSTARAIDLPHEGFGSYFLDTFDRPRRVTGCECERTGGATLGQVLLLANSDEVENKIASGDGRIARLLQEKRPARDALEELYLGALSRFPTEKEMARTLAYVESQTDPRPALEDVLWALLNSKEFMFNH